MLEFIWNNIIPILLGFFGIEFILLILNFILPKWSNIFLTIRSIFLNLANSILFTCALYTNRWDYLFVSIALTVALVCLIRTESYLEVLEDFTKTVNLDRETTRK